MKNKLGFGQDVPNSVYGELKLSEKLLEDLNHVRQQVLNLHESLEECNHQKDMSNAKLRQANEKIKKVHTSQAELLKRYKRL